MEVVIIATLLKGLKLKDISPPNIIADSKVNAIAQALDPELSAITEAIKEAEILPRIDDVQSQVLDLLAWQFHADFYDLTIPLSYATERLKREAVKNSLSWHCKKGTVWAITEALRQLDIEAQFVPWWQFGGQPYTFMLDAIVTGDFYKTSGKDILMKSIVRVVNEAKAARSYMLKANVSIHEEEGMNIYAGGASLLEGEMTLRPAHYDLKEFLPVAFYAASDTYWQALIRNGYSDLQEDLPLQQIIIPCIEGKSVIHPAHYDEQQDIPICFTGFMASEWRRSIGIAYDDLQEAMNVAQFVVPCIEGSMLIKPAHYDVAENIPISFTGFAASEWRTVIHTAYDDIQESTGLKIIIAPCIEGSITVRTGYDDILLNGTMSPKAACSEFFCAEIGADDADMYELLVQFEENIAAKLKDIADDVKSAVAQYIENNRPKWADDDN